MFALQGTIRISRVVALWAFLCAFILGTQPACLAGKQVPFVASYNNNIEADFSSFPLVAVTSTGSALATHLGNATARAISETVNLATGEGVAVHEFTAANGDRIIIS